MTQREIGNVVYSLRDEFRSILKAMADDLSSIKDDNNTLKQELFIMRQNQRLSEQCENSSNIEPEKHDQSNKKPEVISIDEQREDLVVDELIEINTNAVRQK